MKALDVLRFLFPEYQIVASKREGDAYLSAQTAANGTAARPAGAAVGNAAAQAQTVQTAQAVAAQGRGGGTGGAAGGAAGALNAQIRNADTAGDTAGRGRRKDGAGGARSVRGAAKSGTGANGAARQRAAKAFDALPDALGHGWVGSQGDAEAIATAFRRPFVEGFATPRPKNAVLLIGTESRGKTYAVERASAFLAERKVFRYADVAVLSMGDYAADEDGTLFLGDLYNALNALTESVVFNDIDKATLAQRDILRHIMEEGIHRLSKRYTTSQGTLVDASGTLTTGLVSAISANGKYFFYTTTMPEGKILSLLGTAFTRGLGDVITLDPLDEEGRTRLAMIEAGRLGDRCRANLKIRLDVNGDAIARMVSDYNPATGAKGLSDLVDARVYAPLSQMRLSGGLDGVRTAELGFDEADGYVIRTAKGRATPLSRYARNYNEAELDEVRKELDDVVGLQSVKDYVKGLETNLTVQRMREAQGLKAADVSLHMIFEGNPGTGKTTIARIVARYLKAIGALSSGQLSEVTRADLVAGYAGQTAAKTTEAVKAAVGGVLFIDEAYSLCRDESDTFGQEAVDALVKCMEDNRDDLVVILAGYEDEMNEFLATNPGLKSRFPNIVHFDDYTPQEMWRIANGIAESKGYRIDAACEEGLLSEFARRQIKGRNDSGNGRLARNMVEAAIIKQATRVVGDRGAALDLLTPADFGLDEGAGEAFDLEAELSQVIGLDNVKDYIRGLDARLRVAEARRAAGLATDSTQTLHMVFEGNPGTGKTMMARIVARVLHSMGVTKSDVVVETDRSGLVAGYVGQTAIQTRTVIESALGGVLFIDEAYSLAQGGPGDFGREAIDTLVKMMDDNRDSLVVILAGYKRDMERFMSMNAGLKSRFATIVEFPDYTTAQLLQIADEMYANNNYVLTDDARAALGARFEKARADPAFGNGRYVRNAYEKSLNRQALRLGRESRGSLTKEELMTITADDVREE